MKKNNSQSLTRGVAIWAIGIYQSCISPFIGGRAACRFTPSCSEYARIAIDRYGALRGTYLAMRRIMRCRPGGGYGYDPVP